MRAFIPCLCTAHTRLYRKSSKWSLRHFNFTNQQDLCKCKLWQPKNDSFSLITAKKTNKIGRRNGRVSSSAGKHAKRKNARLRPLHNSVILYIYIFPSLINVKKLSLFSSVSVLLLSLWVKKHSFLLESTRCADFLRNEKWLLCSRQMDTTWSGVRSLCFLISITSSSICRAVIKTASLLCVLSVYTNHVRSINHGILKCNRLCKEYQGRYSNLYPFPSFHSLLPLIALLKHIEPVRLLLSAD